MPVLLYILTYLPDASALLLLCFSPILLILPTVFHLSTFTVLARHSSTPQLNLPGARSRPVRRAHAAAPLQRLQGPDRLDRLLVPEPLCALWPYAPPRNTPTKDPHHRVVGSTESWSPEQATSSLPLLSDSWSLGPREPAAASQPTATPRSAEHNPLLHGGFGHATPHRPKGPISV